MSTSIAASTTGSSGQGKQVTAAITGASVATAQIVSITYPDGSVRTVQGTTDGSGNLNVVYPVNQVGTYTVSVVPGSTATTATHTGI